MLLSVCLQPVLQACDLPSVGKAGLACYIVGYPKHKARLRNNGRGGSSYFGRRIGLFVKVIQQVAGPKQGWHTIWELVCFYRCSQIRRARAGPRGPRGSRAHLMCVPKPHSLWLARGAKGPEVDRIKPPYLCSRRKAFSRRENRSLTHYDFKVCSFFFFC